MIVSATGDLTFFFSVASCFARLSLILLDTLRTGTSIFRVVFLLAAFLALSLKDEGRVCSSCVPALWLGSVALSSCVADVGCFAGSSVCLAWDDSGTMF